MESHAPACPSHRFSRPLPAGDLVQREAVRQRLQGELTEITAKIAEKVDLVGRAVAERNLSLSNLASDLPADAAFIDVIQYRGFDFTTKAGEWKALRYAAYLTFPLARDATNLVVERVDFGEAAPIVEAVSLNRLPFEMLRVGERFLVEEKTISYVGSGREVVRLEGSLESKVQPAATARQRGESLKSLVMGGPDFDLDLAKAGSSRREEALAQTSEAGQSLLTSAATRTLSRDYRGIKFGSSGKF